MIESLKFDCLHFRGHIPCKPNKTGNHVCPSCQEYLPISKRILIIKLGAIGDVIRTTPLVVRFRKMYPNCHITWVTHTPDILPAKQIDTIYRFDFASVYAVQNMHFDIAINLDKEPEACSLLKDVDADKKYGFIWNNHHIDIATQNSEHKLITGLFDNISKENTKHYLDEIFEICHLTFENEPYLLDVNAALAEKWKTLKLQASGKPIVGLNTGCGKRWTTRLWPNEHWIGLCQMLRSDGYYPVLLGGQAEDENNKYLAEQTGAFYPGYFSLEEFIALTSQCDVVVTQVSMMMHIVTALKIPLVLMNNIFNRNEFYLYNNGVIVEPLSGCECYYGNSCKKGESCMKEITPATILKNVTELTGNLK
jgi:ADP-heptose:LPS heptosyltransferase